MAMGNVRSRVSVMPGIQEIGVSTVNNVPRVPVRTRARVNTRGLRMEDVYTYVTVNLDFMEPIAKRVYATSVIRTTVTTASARTARSTVNVWPSAIVNLGGKARTATKR